MDEDTPLDPMSLMSHFSVSTIIVSFIFGVIGIYLFRFGKKTLNYPVIFTSVAMMVYPMFTTGWFQDWGVGIGLCALAYYFTKTANQTG
jgi:sugar phosphate permease